MCQVCFLLEFQKSLHPRSALIVIDIQNDFIDGPLALNQFPAKQDPLYSIPIINKLVNDVKFDLVVYAQDWHPEKHMAFYENYDTSEFIDKTKV
jgi:nicotinamidase-related amidase